MVRWIAFLAIDNVLVENNFVLFNLELAFVGRVDINLVDTTVRLHQRCISTLRAIECANCTHLVVGCKVAIFEVSAHMLVEGLTWSSIHISQSDGWQLLEVV